MTRILGLDLGASSIGWALVERNGRGQGRLVACGSRVFPEGVDRDTSGAEMPKNAQRRLKRTQRRQIARRARRKRILREALVSAGLYPAEQAAQQTLDRLDPYVLRASALHRKLSLHEIGRIFLHMAQRRGFLSNRKSSGGQTKEEQGVLAEISELEKLTKEETTLGAFLAAHCVRPGKPTGRVDSLISENAVKRARREDGGQLPARIRGVHTRRAMYLDEFERIWKQQARYHPDVLTADLMHGEMGQQGFPTRPAPLNGMTPLERFGIRGILFFQRPVYWHTAAVGRCELEPRLPRCSRADRWAQKARIYQEVNNLRVIEAGTEERPLVAEERDVVLQLLLSRREVTFEKMASELGLLEGTRFNLERLAAGGSKRGGRSKLKGMETDAVLRKKAFLGKAWDSFADADKDAIVRALLNPEIDEQRFTEMARRRWQLEDDQVELLLDSLDDLPAGYGNLSRKALGRLLPYLEDGLPMMAGRGHDNAGQPTDAIHAAGYLRPDEQPPSVLHSLPAPPDLPNPLVRQALHEVRKLVNAVIREHGCPDSIHIELTREVRGSLEQRSRTRREQSDRTKLRDAAADRIREHGSKVTRDAIDRFLLWEEQDGLCIYTGKPISLSQLFGGEVDVDHILPRHRSLENSLANKVVAFRWANAAKGDRTVGEWMESNSDPRFDYERILQRGRELRHYGKYRRLTRKSIELDDFVERQLRDTAYISRAVAQYVRTLGRVDKRTGEVERVDVVCGKGQLTATLRQHWGLNTVLRQDGLDLKNREDHRHHAVDAIVIALTDRSILKQLANSLGSDSSVSEPWPDFRAAVRSHVDGIVVSHRVRRKIRGALHEETVYGPTAEPDVYVSRQPLTGLTPNMIPQVRDPVIRAKIEERVRSFGIEPGRGGGKIPGKVWAEPLWMKPPAPEAVDAARRLGIPIKRVRVAQAREVGGRHPPPFGAGDSVCQIRQPPPPLHLRA
jgi:CRISPR-associated endonuclease Csn1